MSRSAFLLALLFSSGPFFGQSDFRPAKSATPKEEKILEKMDARLEHDLDALPKKHRSQYKKIYTERAEHLKTGLTEGHFLFDPAWQTWFDGIMQEIWRGNPQLPKSETTLFIRRDPVPNAASHGEGSLVFNIGLLPFLETESQVAFVLAHEIAHFSQDHGNESIAKYVETLNSDEVQQKLKDISKNEFRKTTRLMELLKRFAFSNSRHSRFKESEADSLAIVFLSKTKYRPAAALGTLAILDKLDSVEWAKIDYKKWFDAPQFPFKNSWLEQKQGSLAAPPGGFKSGGEDSDSLKTHPDCQKRIAAAQQILEKMGLSGGSDFVQPDSSFQKLKSWADLEVLESLYDFEHFGYCLFRALQFLEASPDDPYLNAMVSRCLFQLFLSQKNHELGKVLERPDPENHAEYDRFLRFANQFRLKDLAQVNYYFVENRLGRFRENEDFMFAAAAASHANELPAEFLKRKKEYLRKFPRGRFTDFLNQLK